MLLLSLPLLWFPASSSANGVTHAYTVTVDESLGVLSVEAQFSHPVKSVAARSRHAGKYLIDVGGCADDATIRLRNRRMLLPDNGITCLSYSVDLERAATEYRYAHELAPQNLVASPSYWLWRPELYSDVSIDVEFRLPAGTRVSVPWQPLDDSGTRFLLSRSPENASSPVVFGRFDYREIELPGSTLRLSMIAGKTALDPDAITDWIRATATDVSLAYGRFPSPSPQVIVVPVPGSRSAVSFGQVIRDGGETVALTVDPEESIDEYLADWKATHEFSHLMLPYVTRGHRWISEGFAQYYQNVLLTKAGAYEETYAWQKIHDGFARGRNSRPELSPNEAAAGRTRSSGMKVYWSGAAVALIADVQLRERSGGEEGLSDVLGRFQECCLPSDVIWSGPEFFAKLDTLISEPLFMPLYKRYADTAGFPNTSELMARLGVAESAGRVTLKSNAELKEIRDAITRADSSAARWRSALTAP